MFSYFFCFIPFNQILFPSLCWHHVWTDCGWEMYIFNISEARFIEWESESVLKYSVTLQVFFLYLQTSRSSQRTMFAPPKLTVAGVFGKLRDIAAMSGNSVSCMCEQIFYIFNISFFNKVWKFLHLEWPRTMDYEKITKSVILDSFFDDFCSSRWWPRRLTK